MNGSPARGDAIDRWLESHREAAGGKIAREAVEVILDDYHAHADAGIALGEGER